MRILLLLLCGILGVSCTKHGMPEGTMRPANGGIYYGGIFRDNENGELRSLDPVGVNDASSAHIATNIYDNLLTFDADLQLQPELATRWEISDDGTVYTYHLSTDVVFHNDACFANGIGRRMTAHDVKYSFTRVCDFRANTKGYDYLKAKVVGADAYYDATRAVFESHGEPAVKGVSGFEVIDDSTFAIHLVKPFAPFEQIVALHQMFIHPHEAVEKYGENFFQHPVGTGPFSFVSWTPDRSLVLTRNPKYWHFDEHGNRLPYLDGIRYSFMRDDKMQLLEFKAGNLEESFRIANEYFGDIVDEQKQPKGAYAHYQLLHKTALSTQYYGMLNTDPVFRDPRIRRAFNYAIDKDRIIKYVLRGQASGPAVFGLVPPAMPGYASNEIHGYSYDPAKARQLLAEAGYPEGKGFPDVTLQLNAGGGRNVSIAETIQGMLKENLNISINLTQVEFAQHLDAIDAGRAAFYRLGWIADYPEPESFLNLYYGKLVPPGGGVSPINSVRFKNPMFDSLFEAALSTTDRAARMKLYQKAEQIAINEAPMLLIMYDEDYRFLQPYVRNYQNNAMDRRIYKYVWFDPSKF